MPDEFLKIICRNLQTNTPLECRHPLGGPSLNTLFGHDFSVTPFVDVRRCSKCHAFIRITITGLKDIPIVETIPDSEVAFKSMEEVFGFSEIHRSPTEAE